MVYGMAFLRCPTVSLVACEAGWSHCLLPDLAFARWVCRVPWRGNEQFAGHQATRAEGTPCHPPLLLSAFPCVVDFATVLLNSTLWCGAQVHQELATAPAWSSLDVLCREDAVIAVYFLLVGVLLVYTWTAVGSVSGFFFDGSVDSAVLEAESVAGAVDVDADFADADVAAALDIDATEDSAAKALQEVRAVVDGIFGDQSPSEHSNEPTEPFVPTMYVASPKWCLEGVPADCVASSPFLSYRNIFWWRAVLYSYGWMTSPTSHLSLQGTVVLLVFWFLAYTSPLFNLMLPGRRIGGVQSGLALAVFATMLWCVTCAFHLAVSSLLFDAPNLCSCIASGSLSQTSWRSAFGRRCGTTQSSLWL